MYKMNFVESLNDQLFLNSLWNSIFLQNQLLFLIQIILRENMLEKILPYERNLFFLINGSHSYFIDCVMWLFSSSVIWIPVAIFFICTLIYKKKWQEWLPVLIAIILLLIFSDQFSSNICKPFFARLRPTHYPGFMAQVRTVYDYKGGQYGFPSGHATNAFGFATLTILLFRNRLYACVICLWALFISYSRVYLGVHFISDILAGAILGILIGILVFQLYKITVKRINKTDYTPVYSRQRTNTIAIVTGCYILLFSLFSINLIHTIID